MSKTLRIFAKDTRHLWPEITASLALAIGFAATDHVGWKVDVNYSYPVVLLNMWVPVLLVISWFLLIARSVHDEPLIGDRQFWVTRPYGWLRVLLAKLLFIAAYILLPYLLAQCSILHQAGLHPMHVVVGLFLTLIAIFVLILLPLMALSTVTSNITRIIVVVFALAIYTGIVIFLASLYRSSVERGPGTGLTYFPLGMYALCALSACVVLLQYARRRTSLSIALLVLAVGFVTLAGLAENYVSRPISRDYHVLSAGESSPLTISLLSPEASVLVPTTSQQAAQIDGQYDRATVMLGLTATVGDHLLRLDGGRATFSAPGAPKEEWGWDPEIQHGTSTTFGTSFTPHIIQPAKPTQTAATDQIRPEPPTTDPVTYAGPAYHSFSGKQGTLHITYAVTELEQENSSTVIWDGKGFDAPENGHCEPFIKGKAIDCVYALVRPHLTRVTTTLYPSCEGPRSDPKRSNSWLGSTDPGHREVDFGPVIRSGVDLGFHISDGIPYNLCPGTPITFTRFRQVRHRVIEATFPNIDLHDYRKLRTEPNP